MLKGGDATENLAETNKTEKEIQEEEKQHNESNSASMQEQDRSKEIRLRVIAAQPELLFLEDVNALQTWSIVISCSIDTSTTFTPLKGTLQSLTMSAEDTSQERKENSKRNSGEDMQDGQEESGWIIKEHHSTVDKCRVVARIENGNSYASNASNASSASSASNTYNASNQPNQTTQRRKPANIIAIVDHFTLSINYNLIEKIIRSSNSSTNGSLPSSSTNNKMLKYFRKCDVSATPVVARIGYHDVRLAMRILQSFDVNNQEQNNHNNTENNVNHDEVESESEEST